VERKPESSEPDVFDFVAKKVMRHMRETAEILDPMAEPFRSGGLTALEEFYFRMTGKHFDWEEIVIRPSTLNPVNVVPDSEHEAPTSEGRLRISAERKPEESAETPQTAEQFYYDVWIKFNGSDPRGDWPIRFKEMQT
jgi:hypothetical protein